MTREIKIIFCPIDLSPESEGALRKALTFARSFEAKLFVCHCASELSLTGNSKKTRELNKFVKNTIDYFVSGEAEAAKIEWEPIIVENDNAALGIIEAAQCRQADLIIINSTRHPFPHTLLGSVAGDVSRSAPCPVLVVQPQKSREEKISIQRILAAHDFSDYSELALQYATLLAQKFNAELHLLHVINEEVRRAPEFSGSDVMINKLYHQTKERLQKAPFIENHKIPKLITSIRWGKPYREILAYPKEQKIELIAMGARGADFGLETLFGSNVERVLRQAPCAVLVARPNKPIFTARHENAGHCRGLREKRRSI
jgi:nucleotide-binding universal stress UspA family protein